MPRGKRRSTRGQRAGVREQPAAGREVVLILNRRVFYIGLAVLGLLVVFLVGLWLGRGVGGATPQMASLQQQSAAPSGGEQLPDIQVAPVQPSGPQTEGQQPSDLQLATVQVPKGMDPNLMGYTPADPDTPLGDHPRIAIPGLAEDYTYDLGEIPPDRVTEHIFKIKNIGTRDLEIQEVSSSCACTASLVSDKVVPPGGETELKIAYDPTVYRDYGPVERYIQIFSNDPAGTEGEIRFKVKATVRWPQESGGD
ncbi:MAG: DUF1573 domain-containing protein [Anaerolineae bacterium]